MTKHKHKPKMVMVISIGAKPKKKGETGVKKGSKYNTYGNPAGETCPSCEGSGEVGWGSGRPVTCPVCQEEEG